MTLKRKLTLGLGFLFLIIFALVILYSYHIGTLSKDAENILKDNYNSLVYSKNMLSALEDTRTAVISIVFNPAEETKASAYHTKLFEAGQAAFEHNLKAEKNNITEIHEANYVSEIDRGYAVYTSLCLQLVKGQGGRALYFNEFQPAFEKLRQTINAINDLNMQAVERKSQVTKRDSARIIKLMAAVGTVCLILAFVYFWYFPFFISNSIAYLSGRMRELLKKSDLVLDLKTKDETFVILQAINLLENKLDGKDQVKP